MDSKAAAASGPICPICQKQFSINSNLRRHLQEVHSTHPKLEEILKDLSKVLCHRCSRIFFSTDRLNKHLRMCQMRNTASVFCWLCDNKAPIKKRKIVQHYAECHNIDMSVEKLNFDSLEDFGKWKQKMELDTTTKYIIDNHSLNSKYSVHYLKCHRDGYFKSRGKNVRTTKHYKLNGHCPAKIRASESLETGCVEVEFLGTHIGHDNRPDMITKRSTNQYRFVSSKTEHDYCNEEDMVEAVEVTSEETCFDEDGSFQDPSSTESTSEEAEISEMKDRILQTIHQYFNTSTTRDQFQLIENAVLSIGSVLDANEDEAPSPKRQKIMGQYIIGTKLYDESLYC